MKYQIWEGTSRCKGPDCSAFWEEKEAGGRSLGSRNRKLHKEPGGTGRARTIGLVTHGEKSGLAPEAARSDGRL